MRVTYFGQQGQVRMVFSNVAATKEHSGLVELLSVEKYIAPKNPVLPTELCFDTFSTIAIINLAPGEYLEWSADAERS
jgi:hypothetical protein